ncbi:hypothetical protein [Rummeliibacillus stabekisii]|uniref:hypothetical protein n=1 Tax=Rummeliibacillus stabekisii TaxID=241244 RepID=UPI00116B7F53|nr:hypothetical protein [Rummeliibacillus stabekisii]MBB5168979.1 hypothetical protein [Rummeliibacillus stabekisii]GEL05619.1 hypothetical protein RST01_22460 [Rummeliibacillus stabekisii]
MTKEEFIERIHKENIRPGDYLKMLTKITDVPLVLGCVHDNGKWNIFETFERGGHYIIKEFNDENEAFDYFYELVRRISEKFKG